MEKIKNFISSIGKRNLIIYALIISLLIGGGIYLYNNLSSKEDSEEDSEENLESNSKEILKVIPKESAFVMMFTPSNFLAKMDLEDLIESGETSSNKDDLDLFSDMIDDPSITGVNLLSEVLVFHSYEDVESHYLCFSSGIEDEKKFGKFIEDLAKEAGRRIRVKEEDHFSYFVDDIDDSDISLSVGCIWDEEKFIFIAGTSGERDLKDHMEKLINLEEEESIISNEEYNVFYENKKDISIWTSTELLDEHTELIMEFEKELSRYNKLEFEQMFGETLKESLESMIEMYDDNTSTTHIEFADGEIICSSEIIPNETLRDLQENFHQEFNSDILKFIPENNILILSAAVNANAFLDYAEEYPAMEKVIQEAEREMYNSIGLGFDDLFNTFGGSFVANISQFGEIYRTTTDWDYRLNRIITKDTTMTVPLFSIVFDVEDRTFLDKMIQLWQETGDISYNQGYYNFVNAEQDEMFMALDNNIFVITNNQESAEKFIEGGYMNNLASSHVSENVLYLYLDLDMNTYYNAIKDWNGGRIPREAKDIMDIWDDLFESIEMKQSYYESSGKVESEFRITFKDKDQNILRTVSDLLKEEGFNRIMN